MKIKWCGQACFFITTDNNTKLLIDPFNQLPGYKLPESPVDIVTISHEHFDHNNTKDLIGRYALIKESGNYYFDDAFITGINTFHDEFEGAKRGKNIVFRYKIEDLTLCHLGDLGHTLNEDQLNALGNIDILMIPVGGFYTIDAKKVLEVIQQLKPTVIIPMHYLTKAIEQANINIATVDEFLQLADLPYKKENELIINKDNLHDYQGIIELNYE